MTNTYRKWWEQKLKQEINYWRAKHSVVNAAYSKLFKLHSSDRGYVKSCLNKKRNLNHYRLSQEFSKDEEKLYKIYEDEVDEDTLTNRHWNRIQYKNMTNRDCYIWTGFTKKQLIQQAKIVCLPPEDIFLFRVRVYRYYTWNEQEMFFGYSASSLKRNFVRTLDIMYEKYAKPRLLNKSFAPPGISRDIIKSKHTPRFVRKVRGLDEEECAHDQKHSIVVNQDSTYQYSEYIHSNHTLFKAMKSAHKRIPLLKVHIWSCTDGRPIWAVVCYSDFDHADGDIFATCFNKQHLDACISDLENHPNDTLEETRKRHERKLLAFHDLETCEQMKALQKLLNNPADNLISDNGYKTKDGRLKMPAEPPQQDDKRITTAAASWRRSITLVRQTCERMHRWCKRNTFCRQRIRCGDIQYVNKVWNIVMADMKFLEVKLMQDSYETNKFVDLLLALRYVMKSPIEKYYIPIYCNQKLNQKKRQALDKARKKQAKERKKHTEDWNIELSQRHTLLRDRDELERIDLRAEMATSESSDGMMDSPPPPPPPPPLSDAEKIKFWQTLVRGIVNVSQDNRNEMEEKMEEKMEKTNYTTDEFQAIVDGNHNRNSNSNNILNRNRNSNSNNILTSSDNEDIDQIESSGDENYNSIYNNRLQPPEHIESEEYKSLKDVKDYSQTFKLVAEGFSEITEFLTHYVKTNILNYCFYDEPLTSEDVKSFIGKKYANKLAKEYISKMDREYTDFELLQCQCNEYVFLFRNLTSKYKVSNAYDIIISFAEIAYFNKAEKLLQLESILNSRGQDKIQAFEEYATRYKIPLHDRRDIDPMATISHCYFEQIKKAQNLYLDEHQNHWYKWLKNGGKHRYQSQRDSKLICHKNNSKKTKVHLVSQYLSKYNKDILEQLTQRRIELLKCRKEYRWHNFIIGNMRKPRLIQFALDHKIKFEKIVKLKVAELKKFIYEYLHNHDPQKKLSYEKYVNKKSDPYYDAIIANYEALIHDDSDSRDLYIDSDNENVERIEIISQKRKKHNLWNKSININKLNKSDIIQFVKNHKIFGTKFNYNSFNKEKLFKLCETDEYKVWFKLENFRKDFKGGQDKFKFLVAVVKQWQVQFFNVSDRERYYGSQSRQDEDEEQERNNLSDEEEKQYHALERRNLQEGENAINDLPPHALQASLSLRNSNEMCVDSSQLDEKEEDEDEYLKTFKIEQYWYDVDFDLWQSPLARLGITCSCRSGAQLPSCCAHSSTILWLIWFACYNSIENAYLLSDRDKKILDTTHSRVHNFAIFKEWIKVDHAQFGGIARFCHCKNEQPKSELEVFCDGCQYYYHPSCCGTTNAIIDRNFKQFHCKSCSTWKVYTFRNAAPVYKDLETADAN